MNDATRCPLAWPLWKRRTPAENRKPGHFHTKGNNGWKQDLTVYQAVTRIREQLQMFTKVGKPLRVHPDEIIISSNLRVRRDGLPLSSQKEPADPGVALYFELDGEGQVIPCDCYTRTADNMAAIAATLEALRTIERHDANLFKSAMSGFALELPAPNQVTGHTWREVLDYYGDDLDELTGRYRRLASINHPDKPDGDADRFAEIIEAYEQGKLALGSANSGGKDK